MSSKENFYKEALLAAGKVATKIRLVQGSNPLDLSTHLSDLFKACDIYDTIIIKQTELDYKERTESKVQ